jgi:uncharacterized protein YlxW (UPF0749 family)
VDKQPRRIALRWRAWWDRIRKPTPRRRSAAWRISLPVACACAGLLATTSMVNARGTDLRGGRHSDLVEVVSAQSDKVEQLRQDASIVQEQIDELTALVEGSRIEGLQRQVNKLTGPAGLSAVTGPGLVVTLEDAQRDQDVPEGTDPNWLVVHQQDIQAVANALWAGGAEAMALQGQRLVSTTGIKCVGNTVVLQGVPYSPPYRIEAIGPTGRMYDALGASPEVTSYRQYTDPPYNLGWSLRQDSRLGLPAFGAPAQLLFARPVE